MTTKQTGILKTMATQELPESPEQRLAVNTISHKARSRRMKLLQRQGCFGLGTKTVTVQRATTVEDLHAAYNLVHDCFVEEGFIFPNPSHLRMRPYEAMPETATFVAKDENNRVVGVTSIIVDTPGLGLPSEKPYPKEIDSLRRADCKLCEITNLAIAPDFRRTAVLTELIRCYIAHLMAIGCDNAIASISIGHRPFYELLAFETIGKLWSYSQDIDDPVILVRLSMDALAERFDRVQPDDRDDNAVLKQYYMETSPYHEQIKQWSAQSQQAFSDPVFLRQLFVERSNLLRDCSADELEVIRNYWG